jgi:Family of unknown function (DUF5675)
MATIIDLKRIKHLADRTIGKLELGGKFICCTLEDVVRAKGEFVKDRTAIEPGLYPITVTLSPRFKRKTPMLTGVPHHEDGMIRIHRGELPTESSGCPLVGMEENNNQLDRCKEAEDALTVFITKLLKKGPVFLRVH